MPIRLRPKDKERVRIQPEFIKEVLILRERCRIKFGRQQRRLKTQLVDPGIERWQRSTLKKELQQVEYALQLMNDRGEGMQIRRGGEDYELTRLRKLPYVRLMVQKRLNLDSIEQTWLIGETPLFRVEAISDPHYYATRHRRPNYDNVKYNGIYDHGPYFICVDVMCFGSTQPIWHILPKPCPRVRNRHLHAHADVSVINNEVSGNPFDTRQTTCWGKFSGIAHSMCEVWDVPGLFNTLFQFAKILNLDSMLDNITTCPNIKLVKRLPL